MSNLVPILIAVLNSLWQAAIVAALVWLALKLARRMNVAISAATRYVIWWVVLGIVALLPAAPRIKWSRLQPATRTSAPAVPGPRIAAAPEPDSAAIVVLREERSSRWPLWVVGAWAAVFLYRLTEIARSYFYLRGVKRRASTLSLRLPEKKRTASVLLSNEVASPMAVGFLPPAVILPASLESEITEKELHYVLLHEYAHLARRDDWWNLVAHFMGAVLALHPAAWWILRQIEREREMACDDWVVARTGAARLYAESLARLSELRWSRRQRLQGEALAAGIFGGGSRLGERIEVLLRGTANRGSRLLSGFFLTVLLALAIAVSSAPRWIAFAQEPSFEVASIKPGDPNDRRFFIGSRSGLFTATNATLKQLVGIAYDLQDHQISGGPKWLDSDRYSVEGKPDSATPIPPGPAGGPPMRAMLRQLLTERFKLAVHRETKEEQVYELLIAKGGSKLKEADTTQAGQTGMRMAGPGRLQGMAASMGILTQVLAQVLSRSVIDKTGLTAKYDFMLEYTPELGQFQLGRPGTPEDPGPPPLDPNGPSLFTALQEQLGLRLESTKGPVEILVIDHAEKPDAN